MDKDKINTTDGNKKKIDAGKAIPLVDRWAMDTDGASAARAPEDKSSDNGKKS